jgi:bacterioferritin-associated ferredoxin
MSVRLAQTIVHQDGKDGAMIVCSCNVISDQQVFSLVAASSAGPPPVSQVYARLGHRPKCGRCVPAVKKLRGEASAAQCRGAAANGCGRSP